MNAGDLLWGWSGPTILVHIMRQNGSYHINAALIINHVWSVTLHSLLTLVCDSALAHSRTRRMLGHRSGISITCPLPTGIDQVGIVRLIAKATV